MALRLPVMVRDISTLVTSFKPTGSCSSGPDPHPKTPALSAASGKLTHLFLPALTGVDLSKVMLLLLTGVPPLGPLLPLSIPLPQIGDMIKPLQYLPENEVCASSVGIPALPA